YRWIHAVHFSSQWLLDRTLCRIGLCLRLDRLLEFFHWNGNADACAHWRGSCIRAPAFLLRRFHLEGSREIDPPVPWTRGRLGGCQHGRSFSGLGVAREQVGGRVRHSARGDGVGASVRGSSTRG